MNRQPRKKEYQELRDKGWTYAKIAEKYGVTRQAVHNSLTFKYKYKSLEAH